jgi:RNase adaptor protein for sRNA GlmZ degradation
MPREIIPIHEVLLEKNGRFLKLRCFHRDHLPGVYTSKFDCNCLKNPRDRQELRHLTGKDKSYQEHIRTSPYFSLLLQRVILTINAPGNPTRVRNLLTVEFYCNRGTHRSIAMAEIVKTYLVAWEGWKQ